jgi:hypothetical protein
LKTRIDPNRSPGREETEARAAREVFGHDNAGNRAPRQLRTACSRQRLWREELLLKTNER